MNRTRKVTTLLSVVLTLTNAAQANDIEDFFRSLRGGSDRHHEQAAPIHPVGHSPHGYGRRGPEGFGPGYHVDPRMSTRDAYKRHQQFADRHRDYQGHDHDTYDLRHRRDTFPVNRGSHFSFRVSSGLPPVYAQPVYSQPQIPQYAPQYPIVPQIPVVPQPAPVMHHIGQIVDCPVPLATCVRVEDACNIAPNAVPVVVAVRDPNLPPHYNGCVESVIYVEVCVPPCPLQQLVISPCKSRIKMDFGDYQVELKSRRGMVVIDYDN